MQPDTSAPQSGTVPSWKLPVTIAILVLVLLAAGVYAAVRYLPLLASAPQEVSHEELLATLETIPGTITEIGEGSMVLKPYSGSALPMDFTVEFTDDTSFFVRGPLKEESEFQAEYAEYAEKFTAVRKGDGGALAYFDTHGQPDPYTYADGKASSLKVGDFVVVTPTASFSPSAGTVTAKSVYIGGSAPLSAGSVSFGGFESLKHAVAPFSQLGAALLALKALPDPGDPDAPTIYVTFNASPSSIAAGGSSTLSWSSPEAVSCDGVGFSTGGAGSGSVVVSPGSTTNYRVTCYDSSNYSATRLVTVNVVVPPAPVCSYTPPNSGAWSAYSETTSWDLAPGQYFTGLRLRTNCDFTSSANGCMAARVDTITSGDMFYSANSGTWTGFLANQVIDLPAGQYISGLQFRGNCDFTSSEDGCMNVRISTASANTSAYRTNVGYWTSPGGSDQGYSENADYDLAPGQYISGIDFRQNCDYASSEDDCIRIKISYYTVQDGLCGIPDLTAGAAAPASAQAWVATTLSAVVTNSGYNTASGFPNMFQVNGIGNVAATSLTVGGSGGTGTMTASYTFPNAGTFQVRACTDMDTAGNGAISEANEGNNCGSWTSVTVTAPDVTPSNASGPAALIVGQSGTYSATTFNIGNAGTGVNVPVAFAIDNADHSVRLTNLFTATGPIAAGGNAGSSVSYSFGTPGTYWIIPCSDVASPWTGTFNESNEGNNCGSAWVAITVSAVPTASLSISPTSVAYGGSTTISWSSTAATSCTGTNFSTGNAVSGSVAVSATANTTYTVWCTGPGGSASDAKTLTVGAQTFPDLTPGSAPTLYVPFGQAVTVSGTVSNIGNNSTGASFNNMFVTNLNAQGTAWNTAVTAAPATGNLAPGGSASFSYTFPASTFAAPGSYPYAYCVDYNSGWAQLITESNENNNCVGGTIVVTVPDLTAATGAASSGIAGTNVSLGGTISNIGNGSSGVAVQNTVQVCDSPTCGTYNGFSSVSTSGALASGGSQAIAVTRALPATAGSYVYRACANINSTWTAYPITESNYGNNCGAWQTLTVNPPVPASPTGLTATCNVTGTAVTLSWAATPGATSYNPRMYTPTPAQCVAAGWQVWTGDNLTCIPNPDTWSSTSVVNFPVTPGQSYSWWVHAANLSGWSAASSAGFTCTGAANLTAGVVTPTTATAGTPVTFSAPVTNSGTAASGSFPMLFRITENGALFNSAYIPSVVPAGSGTASASYTFPASASPQTYHVSACANYNTAWAAIVPESNYGDNCGPDTIVTVAATPPPTCSVSASPTLIPIGASTGLTWSSSGAASCTGSGFSTGGATSGTQSVTPGSSTAYGLTCTAASGGTCNAVPAVVTVGGSGSCTGVPTVAISASATRVQPSTGTFTLNWSAQNMPAASCTISGTDGFSTTVVPNICAVNPTTSAPRTITTQTTYTINCEGTTKSVTVNVIPKFIEF